jgi:hypothetical protein
MFAGLAADVGRSDEPSMSFPPKLDGCDTLTTGQLAVLMLIVPLTPAGKNPPFCAASLVR